MSESGRCFGLALLIAAGLAGGARAAPDEHLTARGAVRLRIGERVTIRLDAEMRPSLVAAESFPPDKRPSTPDQPAPGVVSVLLWDDPGTGAVLTLQNGLDAPLIYRAVEYIEAEDGRVTAHPTSVCPIPAHLSAFEQWPDPVIGMVVGPFIRTAPDDTRCRLVEGKTAGPPPKP